MLHVLVTGARVLTNADDFTPFVILNHGSNAAQTSVQKSASWNEGFCFKYVPDAVLKVHQL